jgi:hypothetical protein
VVHELAEYGTEGGEIPGDDLGLVVSEVLAKAVLYVKRVRFVTLIISVQHPNDKTNQEP